VDKPELRQKYGRFRVALRRHGFTMLQYSVYVHYAAGDEPEDTLRKKAQATLPSHGQVRAISVTDRRFEKREVYVGRKRRPVEDPPCNSPFFESPRRVIPPKL